MEVIRIPLAKQEEANNKKQRSKLLFNNDTLSDVKFVVRASQHGENDTKRSKIVVPAHKFVLSICSPVFFRMFCGEMAENGEQIELPDCEYEGIFELLRYFYTDEVCLNGNNVMQVLYVAKKYMVSCLAKECVKFLKTNVDSSNVFCVLKHAQQYVNEDLLGLCWYLIDKQTEEAMSSCEFLSIEKSLLQQLLERSTLEIKEVELFKAVDRWAAKECERQNLTADGPVKRQILGDQIFKNIRFPAMKQSDFMEVVLNSKMLTEEEASKIMNQLSCTSPAGLLEAKRSSCLRCCRSKATLDNNPRHCAMMTVPFSQPKLEHLPPSACIQSLIPLMMVFLFCLMYK
ncbi:BTB/POZ domain-containing protein 6-like [Oculina patagonica]